MNLDDLNAAARLKEVVEKIAAEVVESMYPRPRFATVKTVDSLNRKVVVNYPGDATDVTVDGTVILPNVGATVRVAGVAGARFVDEIMTGPPLLSSRTPLNYIRNGALNVWQRGPGAFTGAGPVTADGWTHWANGSTISTTRQGFTLGNTIPGQETPWYLRSVVTSVAGAGNLAVIYQAVEGVRSLAGQTATLSFWAKADAAKNIAVEFEQAFGTGGSPSANVTGIGSQKIALTTGWKRYTVTVSIPSITGKTIGTNNNDRLGVMLWMDAGSTFNARSATLGQQSGTFEFWGLQLEQGATATDFERMSPEEDLRQQQRYLYARTSTSASECLGHGGWATSGTIGNVGVVLPVTMRGTPTVSYTGNWGLSDGVTYVAATGITVLAGQSQPSHVVLQVTVAAGLATFRPHRLETAAVGATFAFTAELG